MSVPHPEVERWLREGRAVPMPAAVSHHLVECDACRTAVRRIDEVRAWFSEDEDGLPADTAAAIRFRLQAEARAERASNTVRSTMRSRRGFAWLGAAAAILLGVALGAGLWPSAPARPTEIVTVRPAPGAVYARVRGAPEHTYRVERGVVTFAVRPLPAGERCLVQVGPDVVEVHGTRFTVRAVQARLESVAVEHGVVSVHLGGGEVRRLTAGEAFVRPESTPSPPSPPTPPAHAVTSPSPPAPIAPTVSTTPAASPSTSRSSPAARRPTGADQGFYEAWHLRRTGNHDAAALAFDALLTRSDLGPQRADVLFWSADGHQRAGRPQIACERLEALLRDHPDAWHASEARQRLERMRAR